MRTSIYNRRKHRKSSDGILQMFWDFYALHELWFRLGGGMEYYYGFNTQIVPEQRRLKIQTAYFDNLYEFFPILYDALERSCRSEIRHVYNFNYRPLNKDTYAQKLSKVYRPFKIDIADMHHLFSHGYWSSGYGGKKWANGTALLLEMKPIKDTFCEKWGYYIDRILDLKHNGGFMLDKTEICVIDNYILNHRKSIKTLDQFLSRGLSNKTKALLITSLPYLNQCNEENEPKRNRKSPRR